MFASRKPLAIALAIVMLFAMLVPAAMAAPAAPQYLHGITITAPVTAAKAYVKTSSLPAKFDLGFTLAIQDTQVYDVGVWWWLESAYNVTYPTNPAAPMPENTWNKVYQAADLQVTSLSKTVPFTITNTAPNPLPADGWYDLHVCAKDLVGDFDPEPYVFCTVQTNVVLLDRVAPDVHLLKPGGAHGDEIWITGKDYLLVGTAEDAWGIKKAWFEYRASPNNDWIKIPATDAVATPGVPGQYEAIWDSSMVQDDWAWIRICAEDMVGHKTCSGPNQNGTEVWVENHYTISLRPGWNLISSPLLPYDTDIADVLLHLNVAHDQVKSVWTYDPTAAVPWQSWAPTGPSTLTEIVDGKGYWIEMKTVAELTIEGTWLAAGGEEVPPEYGVSEGWNLIGYTHFGRPINHFPPSTVSNYLGEVTAQALLRYNASTGHYYAVYGPQHMTPGAGYWLATAANGSIRPGY